MHSPLQARPVCDSLRGWQRSHRGERIASLPTTECDASRGISPGPTSSQGTDKGCPGEKTVMMMKPTKTQDPLLLDFSDHTSPHEETRGKGDEEPFLGGCAFTMSTGSLPDCFGSWNGENGDGCSVSFQSRGSDSKKKRRMRRGRRGRRTTEDEEKRKEWRESGRMERALTLLDLIEAQRQDIVELKKEVEALREAIVSAFPAARVVYGCTSSPPYVHWAEYLASKRDFDDSNIGDGEGRGWRDTRENAFLEGRDAKLFVQSAGQTRHEGVDALNLDPDQEDALIVDTGPRTVATAEASSHNDDDEDEDEDEDEGEDDSSGEDDEGREITSSANALTAAAALLQFAHLVWGSPFCF